MITTTAERIISSLRGADGRPFTIFVDRLLRAYGHTLGVADADIVTTLRTNLPDGGVDTQVRVAFPRVTTGLLGTRPHGDDPNEEEGLKPVCFVFDFAPTRALRQLSEYWMGLAPSEANPENSVKDLVSFLPVLAYDGANMTQTVVCSQTGEAGSRQFLSVASPLWRGRSPADRC